MLRTTHIFVSKPLSSGLPRPTARRQAPTVFAKRTWHDTNDSDAERIGEKNEANLTSHIAPEAFCETNPPDHPWIGRPTRFHSIGRPMLEFLPPKRRAAPARGAAPTISEFSEE